MGGLRKSVSSRLFSDGKKCRPNGSPDARGPVRSGAGKRVERNRIESRRRTAFLPASRRRTPRDVARDQGRSFRADQKLRGGVMRFFFLGSSLVSAYWNGAATYYRGLLKALADRGHNISFAEPDAFDRQAHRDIENPTWADVLVYPPNPDGMEAVLKHAAHADALVKFSGVGVLDEELEHAILSVRRAHQLAIFWDVDAPAT